MRQEMTVVGWRKAGNVRARGQPLNPTVRRRTHYAQGMTVQLGTTDLGCRKTQFAQGQTAG